MTNPLSPSRRSPGGAPRLPTPPTGWPIGSYDSYEEAQQAVDYLVAGEFPVADVTIVGVDLIHVERVLGKLSWARVLGTGAASGAWFGLFVGLLVTLFGGEGNGIDYTPLVVATGAGVVFGLIFAGFSYGSSRGRRDFSSASQLVAGRYDVLCQPRNAEAGRDLLARLAMGPAPPPSRE